MPQPVLTLENGVRAVRILHAVILYSMILFVLMAEDFLHHESHDVHRLWIGFLVTGLTLVGVALFSRLKMLQPAAETLQTNPDDQSALARWRIGNLLSCLLAEAGVLLGFALRFMGGTITQSLPFYIIGIGLMLVWWPRRP